MTDSVVQSIPQDTTSYDNEEICNKKVVNDRVVELYIIKCNY